MATVRDSLYVHGNMPCPSPTHSLPLSLRNPEDEQFVTYSPRPKPLNTEEELRNIQRQAKKQMFSGHTQVAKRNDFFRKIKNLNDGMYNHGAPAAEEDAVEGAERLDDEFVLKGKKVDETISAKTENGGELIQAAENSLKRNNGAVHSVEFIDLQNSDGKRASLGGVVRAPKSKSAKSFFSGSAGNGDQLMSLQERSTRSLLLPQLTIGGGRAAKKATPLSIVVKNSLKSSPNSLLLNSDGLLKALAEASDDDDFAIAEYRFPGTSPRRIVRSTNHASLKRDASNYGSMSLDELKECLHIRQPRHQSTADGINQTASGLESVALSTRHTPYDRSNMTSSLQRSSAFGTSSKTFRHAKRMKQTQASPAMQKSEGKRLTILPRYQFNSVDSYLKFNKDKDVKTYLQPEAARTNGAEAHVTDTALLKMISDMNKPSAESSRALASLASVRLVNSTKTNADLSAVNGQHVVPCNSPTSRRSASIAREKRRPNDVTSDLRETLQHVVVLPSEKSQIVQN